MSEDVVDRRIRALLDEYVRLTGADIETPEPGLLRVRLQTGDVASFRGRAQRILALDLATLERHPDAELPVVGSAFWNDLVGAIRQRGLRLVTGALPVTVTDDPAVPDVEVIEASVSRTDRRRETRRIVRLTVKVTIAAGTAVHEKVIQSDAVDLFSGRALPLSAAALLDAPGTASVPADAAPAPAAAADRLVPVLIEGIEQKVTDTLAALRQQAQRDLTAELARIDAYYDAVKQEVLEANGRGSAQLRTVEHEHQKRRSEEERRHEVRVSVEPLQVLERSVIAERASWTLESPAGRRAELHGVRYLSGDGGWGVHCRVCRQPAQQITVCRSGHAAGAECTLTCSVCTERFCTEHGRAACAVDGAPMCVEHAAECWSCGRDHCVTHQGQCADGHDACVECLVACGRCARTVCRKHATTSHEESPLGARVLCSECVVYCEGATSEPVGRDEALACGTCGIFVCERHQVACVVDGSIHCSKHVRRTDRSRKFVCDSHMASCGHEEPDIVFAASEVHACVTCGREGCERHAALCFGDQRWHCRNHLEVLNDQVDALACAEHRSVCHVDRRAFSMEGTSPCDSCGRATCRTHTKSCSWCGGRVCSGELPEDKCLTCRSLATAEDIPHDVIAAIARLRDDLKPKQRLVARDGGRFVIQLDLGWTRRMVVTVPHGAARPVRVLRHSLFGSRAET